MKSADNKNNAMAVKYLGRALMALIVGIVICFLASLGYNTYIRFSQEKVEVQATHLESN